MVKKTFLTALFILMTVLGAEAQKTKISNYSSQTVVEGNGNVVTRDFEVTEFDEISMIWPATVNYTVADEYSCRVTLDDNLFEYLDIHTKGDALNLGYVTEKVQHINLRPTKFVIDISAPTIEEINTVGSGDF